jgi:hypothetical protein
MFSAIIPLTTKPIESVISELKRRFKKEGKFVANIDLMGGGADYLGDLEAINKMLNWIQSKN